MHKPFLLFLHHSGPTLLYFCVFSFLFSQRLLLQLSTLDAGSSPLRFPFLICAKFPRTQKKCSSFSGMNFLRVPKDEPLKSTIFHHLFLFFFLSFGSFQISGFHSNVLPLFLGNPPNLLLCLRCCSWVHLNLSWHCRTFARSPQMFSTCCLYSQLLPLVRYQGANMCAAFQGSLENCELTHLPLLQRSLAASCNSFVMFGLCRFCRWISSVAYAILSGCSHHSLAAPPICACDSSVCAL